jgi:hypothetical protein
MELLLQTLRKYGVKMLQTMRKYGVTVTNLEKVKETRLRMERSYFYKTKFKLEKIHGTEE